MLYHNLFFLLDFHLVDLFSAFLLSLGTKCFHRLKLDLFGRLVETFEIEIRFELIEKLLGEYLQALVLIEYQ